MTSPKNTLEKVLRGTSDANIRFGDLTIIIEHRLVTDEDE